MKQRTLVWIGIVIVVLIASIGFAWTFFGVHQVTMTEEQLQGMIDSKMPHTTNDGSVTVSNVKLDLAGDQIALYIEVDGEKFKMKFSTAGRTKGNLRYNSSKGWFYFHPDDLQFEKLEVGGTTVADQVGKFIDKWVDSKKVSENKAEIMEKAGDLAEATARKSAEVVLARVPVYKLKDDLKGNVVRVLLKDVEVKDRTIIAHLSLWQLTKTVILYTFAIIVSIALAVVLFMNPQFGTTFILLGLFGSGFDS